MAIRKKAQLVSFYRTVEDFSVCIKLCLIIKTTVKIFIVRDYVDSKSKQKSAPGMFINRREKLCVGFRSLHADELEFYVLVVGTDINKLIGLNLHRHHQGNNGCISN